MTTKYCCCFDLHTGNVIIAWLDVLIIFFVTRQNAQGTLVYVFAGFLSLYAIYEKRPEFLWPSLIVRGISMVTLIIVELCLLAGSAILMDERSEKYEFLRNYLVLFEILMLIAIALQGYFFYVILSYYKQKKAEALEKLQVAQFDNVEQGLYPKINEQKNFQ